jgi:hypothetical protein
MIYEFSITGSRDTSNLDVELPPVDDALKCYMGIKQKTNDASQPLWYRIIKRVMLR